jgi:hypothetical protein
MRALWTQDVIEFDSRLHQVREAGISPSPEPITPMDQRAGMH